MSQFKHLGKISSWFRRILMQQVIISLIEILITSLQFLKVRWHKYDMTNIYKEKQYKDETPIYIILLCF